MGIHELVRASRSFRGYDPNRRLTEEELKDFVDCARFAPSTGNVQALKFYLAWEPEEVSAIQATTGWARALPQMTLPHPGKEPTAFIVICQDMDIDTNTARLMRDVGIAAQTILLAATEQGLGGCMIGSFQANALRKAIRLPEYLTPQLVVALGKPAEEIRLIEIAPNQPTAYYRDENDVHYVPKRGLEDIIVQTPPFVKLQKGFRPGTEKRLALLRKFTELSIMSQEAQKLTEPMVGKTDEEKERIAEELVKQLSDNGDSANSETELWRK